MLSTARLLGAGQHFLAPLDRLANQLGDDRGLARTRRAVDQGQVAGREGQAHGLALGRIEARAEIRLWGQLVELRLALAEQDVAELSQAVAAGLGGPPDRRPLPLDGHVVAGQVDPPQIVIRPVVGQNGQGDADRAVGPLVDDAAAGLGFARGLG